MARKFLNGVQSYFNDSNYTLLGYDSLDVVGGDLILKRAGAEKLRIGANTATFAGDVSLTAGALSITSDGSNAVTFTESGNGDFTIDVPDDLRLDAGGGDIVLRAGGTEFSRLTFNNPGLHIQATQTNASIYLTPNGTGNIYASTDTLVVTSDEGEPAKFLLRADQGDDNGDDWYITNETSNVLTFKNNIQPNKATVTLFIFI